MTDRSDRPSAYDQAVKLLARRTHFRLEIVRKLVQRHYSESEIDEAVGRLEERRYLDDAQASRSFVEGRLARGGYGRRRLVAELSERGVDDATVREVLDELLPEDELPAAREEARRSGKSDPAAVARRLERRGFSPSAIAAVLREGAWAADG